MPQVRTIEKKINKVEGFDVVIKHDGKNVRSNLVLPNQYQAQKMTRNNLTVGQFRSKFKKQYAGYDVDVLKADGSKANGQTKLATVRDTYLDD